MALRFYAEFTSREGNQWTANIYDDDFTGTAAESAVGPPGFELEYFGGEDIYSPLMPSTCRVPWAIQSAAEEQLLADLADFQEGRFMLEIQQTVGGVTSRHWIGVMSPDSIKIPDEARPFFISLDAVCGLALLSRKEYDITQQISGAINNSGLDHLLNCLRSIPGSTSTFWPVTSVILSAPVDIRPNTGTATDNFLQQVFFQAVTNDIFQGSNSVGTYEDMLVQICTMTNSRLFQRNGYWMLQPVSRQMGVSTSLDEIKNFDRLGSLISTTTETGLRVTIDQTNRHRTAGFFSFLPSIRKISRKIDFFGNAPFAGKSYESTIYFANNGNTASPYNIGHTITGTAAVTLPTTQTVRVRGGFRIWVPWFNGSVAGVYQPLERVQRFQLELKVRVGTKYLRRTAPFDLTYSTIEPDQLYLPSGESSSDVEIFNPGTLGAYQWTTDSSARVQYWSEYVVTGANDFQGIPRNTAINFDFESPEIGSAEQADMEVTATYTGYHGEATGANPDAFVSQSVKVAGCYAAGRITGWLGDGSDSADAITFGADIDNGATEELEIESGIYAEVTGDGVQVYTPSALLQSDLSEITNFTSSTTTAGTPLAELVCIDRLQHFGKMRRVWQGTIYSGEVLDPMNLLLFDSATWMPTQISYSAELDDFDLECTQVAALGSLDPDSVTPVREVGEIIDSVNSTNDVLQEQIDRGARGRSDLSDTIADVNTDFGARFTLGIPSLGDVDLAGLSNNYILKYSSVSGTWKTSAESGGGGVSYHDRYSTEAESQRSGAAANVELYYTARPDGDGLAESATSDSGVTDTINRTLYFSQKHEADPDTAADWTEYTTQPADNATFATAKAALLAGLNQTDGTANTRGTLPLSLKIVRTTSAATNLLLNDYPGAEVAYSLRKLDNSYSGSCIRVRRSSDNAEADIGFDSAGDLDTAAVATHCGSSTGFVVTWYDQSGNTVDATQSVAGNQPQIYNGTAVITVNGKAAVDFDGFSDRLDAGDNGDTTGDLSIFATARIDSNSQVWGPVIAKTTAASNSNRWSAGLINSTYIATVGTNHITTASTSYSQQLATFIFLGNTSMTVYSDGSQEDTLSVSGTVGGSSFHLLVGAYGSASGTGSVFQYHNGPIQEVIYYNSDESSNKAGIESNINAYFSVF